VTFDLAPKDFLDDELAKKAAAQEPFKYIDETAVVELCNGITREQLSSCGIFRAWFTTLALNLQLQDKEGHPFQEKPFILQKIMVQSVDWIEDKKPSDKPEETPRRRILFLKIDSLITNGPGKPKLPGIAFLRGGSVAMLVIVKPKDSRQERFVVLTEQARIPGGSMRFKEIPAGMLDADNNIVGKAITEIEEETELKFKPSELINLTELSIQAASHSSEFLQRAMYPSPGGSDEFISIFLCIKELDRLEIQQLQNKLTGIRTRGELIKLSLCPYEDLWKEGARDAKTLAAWTLYEGLLRSGVLQRKLDERKGKAIRALQDRTVPVQEDSDDD